MTDGNRKRKKALSLNLISIILALTLFIIAYYMFKPVDYTGIGKLGFIGLLFFPQLIFITAISLILLFVAKKFRAGTAVIFSGLAAIISFTMTLVPGISIWNRASAYGVELSLGKAIIPKINSSVFPKISVNYLSIDGKGLFMDVWKADKDISGKPHPAIIRIHGGGWIEGSRGNLGKWISWFNEQGFDFFDVDYRMPPADNWNCKNEIADVKYAIGWIRDHASQYGIDTNRISLAGYSAGGNLALLAAFSMGDSSLPSTKATLPVDVRSIINFYGPSDLEQFENSGSPEYVSDALIKYLGTTKENNVGVYRLLSPINFVRPGLPPVITIIGERDRIVPLEQAEILDNALRKAGNHHELYTIPWTDHGFDASWNSFPTQIAQQNIQTFLDKYSK